MAQAHNFTLTSTSAMVQIPECYADRVFYLAPWETQLLTAVGMNSLPTPCSNPVYHYLEVEDRPARTLLNDSGGISNSDTDIIFEHAVFAAGEIVQIDEETILLGTTSDNLTFSTCTRSVGAGAAAAHSDDAPAVSLGKPRAQGAAGGSTGDRVIEPNDVTNYTQIFSKDIVVSGTAQAVTRYGGTGSEMSAQEMFQDRVIKKEMQNSLIWGVDTAAATTATAGMMDGIYERLATPSSADLSDAAITLDNVEDAVESSQDWGGSPNVICVGLYTKRVIDAWGAPYVQHNTDPMSPANIQFGVNVTKLYVGGVSMDVLVLPDLHAHALVLDTSRIGFGPLVGRDLKKVDLAKDGDRDKSQVIGEYTCACANPKAHYIFTSVKFT